MPAKSKSTATTRSAKKPAAKPQPQQQEPSLGREPSTGRVSITYSAERVEKISKQVVESHIIGIALFAGWFAPIFNGLTIWKLLIGSASFSTLQGAYSSDEITALQVAVVAFVASFGAILINNRHLTAFLTLIGCLITFSIAFLHTDAGFTWAAKKKLFDCQFLGCAFWIYAAVNGLLQYEFRK
jgi:hypothetical protein